jgi:hypothetical protein
VAEINNNNSKIGNVALPILLVYSRQIGRDFKYASLSKHNFCIYYWR